MVWEALARLKFVSNSLKNMEIREWARNVATKDA